YATNSSYSLHLILLHLILRIEPDANGRHPTPNGFTISRKRRELRLSSSEIDARRLSAASSGRVKTQVAFGLGVEKGFDGVIAGE
ncbi:MAG: hypothetical protein ACREA9_12395, partial [Pyrinomonadaceae bacterium]